MNILLHGMNVLNKLVLVVCMQKLLDSGKFLGFRDSGRVPRFSRFRGDLLKWGEDNYSGGLRPPSEVWTSENSLEVRCNCNRHSNLQMEPVISKPAVIHQLFSVSQPRPIALYDKLHQDEHHSGTHSAGTHGADGTSKSDCDQERCSLSSPTPARLQF